MVDDEGLLNTRFIGRRSAALIKFSYEVADKLSPHVPRLSAAGRAGVEAVEKRWAGEFCEHKISPPKMPFNSTTTNEKGSQAPMFAF